MADTYNKKEREKKKDLKRKEKQSRKDARKEGATEGGWESMIAYVDENGNLSDTPPDPTAKKKEIKANSIEIGVPRREKEEDDLVIRGIVNYFDDSKGYGFIKSNDEDFFFHQNNYAGVPLKGQKVRFEKEKGLKGWVAIKIVLDN